MNHSELLSKHLHERYGRPNYISLLPPFTYHRQNTLSDATGEVLICVPRNKWKHICQRKAPSSLNVYYECSASLLINGASVVIRNKKRQCEILKQVVYCVVKKNMLFSKLVVFSCTRNDFLDFQILMLPICKANRTRIKFMFESGSGIERNLLRGRLWWEKWVWFSASLPQSMA